MRYYVKQIGQKDCGFTCLKMLLAMYHKNKDYLYYPSPQIESYYSLKDIILLAKKEKLTLKATRVIDKFEFYDYKTRKPFLAPVKNENALHMVLVKRVGKKKLLVYDPALGIYNISKEEFIKKWNGEMLEVDEVEESKFKKEKIKILPNSYVCVTLFFQVVSFLFLVLATLFIDKNFSFLISFSLFLGYVITEFIYQRFIIKSFKYFDNNILMNDYSLKRKSIKKYFEPMNKFKFTAISSPIQHLNCALILCFGIFILTYNDLANLIIISIIFFAQVCFKIYEKHYLDINITQLELCEKKIFYNEAEDKVDFISSIKKLNDETYKIISYFNFKKYFLMFFSLACCLIYQGFMGNITINFMLFHFFLYIYLEENFDKLLNINKYVDELKYYKCLYLYHFH